jgi:ornithine carbamoyltransferase
VSALTNKPANLQLCPPSEAEVRRAWEVVQWCIARSMASTLPTPTIVAPVVVADQWVSAGEAARIAKRSKATIKRWRIDGTILAQMRAKRWEINLASLNAHLAPKK